VGIGEVAQDHVPALFIADASGLAGAGGKLLLCVRPRHD